MRGNGVNSTPRLRVTLSLVIEQGYRKVYCVRIMILSVLVRIRHAMRSVYPKFLQLCATLLAHIYNVSPGLIRCAYPAVISSARALPMKVVVAHRFDNKARLPERASQLS